MIICNGISIALWINTRKKDPSIVPANIDKSLFDTLKITDSTYFKFFRNDQQIDKIELYMFSKSKIDGLLIESISFHRNGCVKKIETMGLGYSERKTEDGIVYLYNLNTLSFDDSLNLQSYYLTKNYKVVANSEK